MAHPFTSLPPPGVRQHDQKASSKLRPTVVDRDTSDRPLPPYQPVYLHPRSWLSSYLRPGGLDRAVMDRGTRRFTTSSPASAGPEALAPGVRRGHFLRSSFWHPCRPAAGVTPPSQATVNRASEPRPRSPWFREETGRVGDPVCLPSIGRSGYRAPGRSRSAPCDANATP